MLSVNILFKQPLSSARIKSSNIVFIRHKLSLSCSISDFIKHKCSFQAIIILALNSPLSQYVGSPGHKAHYYAELAVSSTAVTEIIAIPISSTHRGMARLSVA